MARGSIEVRLRPVGSTSARPRLGAPAGPGATRRASRAASKAARSQSAEARTAVSAPVAAASRRIVSSSGDRPKTCRPSRMLSSLMSQSWASSLAMAWRLGSPFTRPQSAASPLVQARSTISSSRKTSRRRSRPSAAAYSSMMPSSSASGPCRPAALSGGVRWPMVTAAEPPLGLHRLARIVDDEGIDHRQRAQHDLGPAVARQRQRLAGQPFQVPCVPRWISASILGSRSQA